MDFKNDMAMMPDFSKLPDVADFSEVPVVFPSPYMKAYQRKTGICFAICGFSSVHEKIASNGMNDGHEDFSHHTRPCRHFGRHGFRF